MPGFTSITCRCRCWQISGHGEGNVAFCTERERLRGGRFLVGVLCLLRGAVVQQQANERRLVQTRCSGPTGGCEV